MDISRRFTWVRAALLGSIAYFLIGRLFPQPADHLRTWRLAAWLASGGVYGAHIGYEHFQLRSSRLLTASHTAAAVAMAAMALALAGMMHSMSEASAIRPAWALALVAWPVIAALPAFLVAFVAAAILTRLPRHSNV